MQRQARQSLGSQADNLLAQFKGKSPAEIATLLDMPTMWAGLEPDFETFVQSRLTEIAGLGLVTAARQLPAQFTLPFAQASRWAGQHAANLVAGIDATTRGAIRERVMAAIERGVDPLKLEQELIDLLSDMPAYRARRIADTEVMTAYHQGKVISFTESSVVWGKRWRAAPTGACLICRGMDGQIVRLGQPFDTGGIEVPEGQQAHPHCRCTVQPVTFREAMELGLFGAMVLRS